MFLEQDYAMHSEGLCLQLVAARVGSVCDSVHVRAFTGTVMFNTDVHALKIHSAIFKTLCHFSLFSGLFLIGIEQ